MWKAFISLLTRAIVLAEDLQRLREQVKEHSRLLDELAENQTNLRYEYQLQRERDARERERERYEFERNLYEHRHATDSREKELLQLEVQTLQAKLERLEMLNLPAAPAEKKPDES